MSKRPPNELESKLHQAALSSSKKEITAKQAESIVSDANARAKALNFLLGVGLFKSLKDVKGNISFRAVTKNELVATKDLTPEENMILNHIKSSGNEGIWSKHLKTKTNLHQTIIDRAIKTLTQRKLVKRVPSVQHPTRKIYMLEGVEPSIALTGGPWYTDNELDTEFIQHLTEACLKMIRDVSFPKRRNGGEGSLYPISNAPEYPTSQSIRNSLKKARLTDTELTVEHVEMLLNVLILDGKVEKLPSFGSSLWDSNAIGDGESGDESSRRSQKKRKHRSGSDDEKPAKRKRKKRVSSDDESDSESEDSSSRRKARRKRTKAATDSEESDSEVKRKRKKKKRDEVSAPESEDDSSRRRKKKKRDVTPDSDSETESDAPTRRKSSKAMKRSPSPFESYNFDNLDLDSGSGGYVYRAIKEEKVLVGWSEAPCSQCPSFDFCKDNGPVNPRECVYYGDWLVAGSVAMVDIEV
ncbi:RNA polymerase Rpc34 [Crucibulum laeve]|uniref:RNA polymerase Rpc34 n=1 Tax=Crucibulum laeve TaxID=68775 RepID=A0A5C3MPM3_9AGAR|nr:RNA polymerase Rpc34 [Crucibulum laeve]